VLKEAQVVDGATLYPLITLQEPEKSMVLGWAEGNPIPRRAFVIAKKGEQTFEGVVSLGESKLESWEEVVGVQPSILPREGFEAQRLVLAHPDFRAGLAQRGITNVQSVFCTPLTVGYFGLPEEEGRRLLRVPCFLKQESSNPLARPIEGLYGLVDVDTFEVVRVLDTGVRPIPPNTYQLDEASISEATPGLRPPVNPTEFSQPEGANFTVKGHQIAWQGWNFHQRLDQRAGLIISNVAYQEVGSEPRSVLYQGSVSEVFVPYQDPDVGWYWRTFMDAGELGLGLYASTLVPGIDCPKTATFFDANLSMDDGSVSSYQDVICIFEQPTGAPIWRHFEASNSSYEGRSAVELVVRTIATVGNYDYILDWIFTQDARLRVAIGATGIDLPKNVATTSVSDQSAADDTAYGTLVGPNLVAPHHSHFFNFRLDLDVDGTENSFMLGELVPGDAGASPRAGIWQVKMRMLEREQEAQLDVNPMTPTLFHVVNENKKSSIGHSPSYMLMPMNSAAYSLLPDEDPAVARAFFIQNHLWVTPYRSDELYAAGRYVNQSRGGEGLPAWTSQNRPLINTDLILWYTAGFHHVTHTEDWPVLPVHWYEFELVPYNFFEHNPALDLRSNP
jgi:primary-amine oxidase